MTSRPRAGAVPRLAVLGAVAATVLVPGGTAGAVAGPAGADAPRAAPAPAVSVALTTLEPVTVRPGRVLRVGGVVATDRPLRGVSVRLEVGTTPYLARSTLTEAAAPQEPGTADLSPVTVPVTGADDRLGSVAPGPEPFRVQVRTDDLPLDATGVYPLRLRVTALTAGVSTTVAVVDTFLPWSPRDAGVRPTRLLWLWPLVDQPRRDSQGRFVDDALDEAVGPGGRLSSLLAAARGRPVAWYVDPALLADVDALAQPHQQVGEPDSTLPPSADARRWLADLRSATAGADFLGLPYGDPDLVALREARRTGLLRAGQTQADAVFRRVLGRPARTDLAWPAEGYADPDTLQALATAGAGAVLLSGDAVPLVDPPPWTPSGRADLVEGRLPALLSDPTLDALVAAPGDGPGALLLARQQFLAQTMLITVELPSDPRLAVVVPPRRWDPDPAWPSLLLDSSDRAAWLRPVSFDQARGWPAPSVSREEPRLPQEVAGRTVPSAVVDGAGDARQDLVAFRAILSDVTPAVGYDQALLGTVSTAWRGQPETAELRLADTVDALDADRAKVRIVSRGATLSSGSAPLPVTVRNQLDQPVTVRLSVTSQDPLRLRVSAPDDLLAVPAGGSRSVSVELDAVATGRLAVEASLLTPGGRPYAESVVIPVDVRAYGRIALIVFGLAAALLVLGAAVRITRRIRGSRGSGAA